VFEGALIFWGELKLSEGEQKWALEVFFSEKPQLRHPWFLLRRPPLSRMYPCRRNSRTICGAHGQNLLRLPDIRK
jgi:hypothetical protein